MAVADDASDCLTNLSWLALLKPAVLLEHTPVLANGDGYTLDCAAEPVCKQPATAAYRQQPPVCYPNTGRTVPLVRPPARKSARPPGANAVLRVLPNSEESHYLDELLALKKSRKATRAASRLPLGRRRSTATHVFATLLPPPPPPPPAPMPIMPLPLQAATAVAGMGPSSGKARSFASRNQQLYLSNFLEETAPSLDLLFPLGQEDGMTDKRDGRSGAPPASACGSAALITNTASTEWIDCIAANVFSKELSPCAMAPSPADGSAGGGDCPWAAWALLESAINDSL